MREAEFRKAKIKLPESIDELTPEQYIYYIYLGSWLTSGDIDINFWKVRWISFLLGLKSLNYTILQRQLISEAESIADEITPLFLIETNAGLRPTYKTCRNLLPEYKGYKGPKDWLNDITFGKFVECITIREQIAATSANNEGYEEIARALYNIPEKEHVPDILAWHAPVLFDSVWSAIESGPIEVNGKMIDFSIIFKGDGMRKTDDKTGWAGIAFEVAAGGVFGNMKELDDSPFWAVLMYLYKCKFEYNHEKSNKK